MGSKYFDKKRYEIHKILRNINDPLHKEIQENH